MKKIKVLFMIDSLGAGGKERQFIEFLKGIYNRKDFKIVIVIMSQKMEFCEEKIIINKFQRHYLLRKKKKDFRIFLNVYNICKEFIPDIIHTWDSMCSVYAAPVARILGIKFINGMIRNGPYKLKFFGKAWIRSKLTFPFSDFIVSNSNAGINSYKPPLSKSICIYNGFDIERMEVKCNKINIMKKFSINTEKVIGMVASFSDKKDYKTYIEAAQMILEKRDDVTFLTVGDGPNYEKCRKLVKSKFYQRIRFLGRHEVVEPIIYMFDIGVLATYSEGISNSIMEYMALGKPVVATDSGGTKELVLNGITGFLVNPRDVIDLSIKIEQLLNNNKLATRMGNDGKERISKNFGLERMTSSYVSLYRSILNKN